MSPFGLPESCAPNTRPNTRVTQTGLGRRERSDRSPRPVTSPSSGGYPARARLQWLPPGVVRRWLIKRAGLTVKSGAQTGAVTLLQHLGSALNAHLHFHMVYIDGVFDRQGHFHPLKGPTPGDLDSITHQIAQRVARYLEKPGVYGQTWAQRLKRVFAIDIEKCEKCGSKMKVIASIEDPDVIDKILKHLGLVQSSRLRSSPHNRSPPENMFEHTTTLF